MEIVPKRRFARSGSGKIFVCVTNEREVAEKRETAQQVEVGKALSEFRESRSKISVQFESKRFRETIARIVTAKK